MFDKYRFGSQKDFTECDCERYRVLSLHGTAFGLTISAAGNWGKGGGPSAYTEARR